MVRPTNGERKEKKLRKIRTKRKYRIKERHVIFFKYTYNKKRGPGKYNLVCTWNKRIREKTAINLLKVMWIDNRTRTKRDW